MDTKYGSLEPFFTGMKPQKSLLDNSSFSCIIHSWRLIKNINKLILGGQEMKIASFLDAIGAVLVALGIIVGLGALTGAPVPDDLSEIWKVVIIQIIGLILGVIFFIVGRLIVTRNDKPKKKAFIFRISNQ